MFAWLILKSWRFFSCQFSKKLCKIIRIFRRISFQLLTWHWHICCHRCHCDHPFQQICNEKLRTSVLHQVLGFLAYFSPAPRRRYFQRTQSHYQVCWGCMSPHSGAHSNPEGVLAGHDWNTCNGRCSRCMRPHQMPEHITSHQLCVFHGCHVRSTHMSFSC